MSQITKVDHDMNFTEIAAAPAAPVRQPEDRPVRDGIDDDKELSEDLSEERRVSRDLTSILISGRLPE